MMLLYSVTSMMQEPERKGTHTTVVEHQACEQAETKNYAFVRLGAQAKLYAYLREFLTMKKDKFFLLFDF
jgi:hypothetical protein